MMVPLDCPVCEQATCIRHPMQSVPAPPALPSPGSLSLEHLS
jgi:hypothetical protein